MKKQIIILTGNNKFFGQTRKPWVSLDFDKMEMILKKHGISVRYYEFHEVLNKNIEIKNSIVFYTFSQKLEIRNYINDIIFYLTNFNNKLIPNYDLLKCHENKGYQELLKKKLGIKSLNAFYFSNLLDLDSYKFDFPIILKTVDGSNGNGVFLIRNKAELRKTINNFEKIPFLNKLDLLRRKYLRKRKNYKEYPKYSNEKDLVEYTNYITPNRRFVLQEFVPNLKWDFRVLIIFDKYYITKRHVRDNDFRASGAKKFDFNFEPDEKILFFAKKIYSKFDTPFLSIDIAFDSTNCFLIEFQALHFGLNVMVKSSGYYSLFENKWKSIKKKPEIEKDLMDGLIRYLEKEE